MNLLFLRYRWVALWSIVASLSLSACISIGQPFPTQNVRSIMIGKSTQSDITTVYGPPFRTGVDDGDTTWTYVNYKLHVFGQQCTQDLVVRFNADNTVKSYTYNSSAEGSCPPPAGAR